MWDMECEGQIAHTSTRMSGCSPILHIPHILTYFDFCLRNKVKESTCTKTAKPRTVICIVVETPPQKQDMQDMNTANVCSPILHILHILTYFDLV